MKIAKKVMIETINELIGVRNKIFDQIVGIGMEIEFSKEVGGFKSGEIYHLELAHFEDSNNTSIQKLVELCKTVEGTVFSLMNLNGIDEDEVDL